MSGTTTLVGSSTTHEVNGDLVFFDFGDMPFAMSTAHARIFAKSLLTTLDEVDV